MEFSRSSKHFEKANVLGMNAFKALKIRGITKIDFERVFFDQKTQ
jgi:hypothetical protein